MAKNNLKKYFFFIFSLFILSAYAFTCPIWLWIDKDLRIFQKKLIREKKANFALEVYAKKNSVWYKNESHWDGMNVMGGLDFQRQGVSEGGLKPYDRLVVDPVFGEKVIDFKDFPCKHEGPLLAVFNRSNLKEAFYIAYCQKKKSLISSSKQEKKVHFLREKLILKSPSYKYLFRPKNQILFSQLFVRKKQAFKLLAENSTLMIFSDLAYWPFDLHLDSSNIRSVIRHVWHGALGVNIGVSFFLHIALLKIDLSLMTDVSFYKDAAYLPMVLYFPVNAKKFLNKASGIIYHWSLPKGVSKKDIIFGMPKFHASDNEQSERKEEINNKYCPSYRRTCSFSIDVRGEVGMKMEFSLSKDLVRAGFYPQALQEPFKISEELGWDLEKNNSSKEEVGLFFRSANLTEGHHAWDLWLKPLVSHEKKPQQCPHRVFLREINL